MKLKRQVEIVEGLPDLTALINVVLLLVFFFLLSSTFVQRPGLKIDLPVSKTLGVLPYESLVVMITAPDEVFFRNRKMTLGQLREELTREAANSVDQQVVIQADGRVPYATIVEVMDMAFQCNFQAVNLATRVDFAGETSRQ